MRKEALWLLATAIVLLAATAVRADTTITACQALSAGTTYRLTQNITFTGACLTGTQAADITVNCDGFTLHGNFGGAGVSITHSTGFVIGNCTVLNTTNPVLLHNTTNSIIRDLVAKRSTLPVTLERGSNNVSIINGHFSNSSQAGVFFFSVSGSNARNITVTLSAFAGVELNNASGVVIANSNMSRNVENGVFNQVSSNHTLIENNTVMHQMTLNGITAQNSNNITVRRNTVTHNGDSDFQILFDGATNGLIEHNYAAYSTDNSGIIVWKNNGDRESNGNLVNNNTCFNCPYGFDLENGGNNVVANNTVINSSENSFFIYHVRNNTYRNNSIVNGLNQDNFDYGDSIIYMYNVTNVTFTDLSANGGNGFFWRPDDLVSDVNFTNVSLQNIPWGFVIGGERTGIRFSGLSYSNVSRPFVKNQTTAVTVSSSSIPSGLQVRNTNGEVNFTGTVTVGAQPLTFATVLIGNRSARINTTNESALNVAARIMFTGVTLTNPQPTRDHDDDGLFDLCYPPACGTVGYSGGRFVFTVSGWSNHSITEAPAAAAPEFGTWMMMLLALGMVLGGVVKMRKK